METTFKLPKIRTGHRVDIASTSCYWFEIDHAGETPRSLLSLFDIYLNQYQWDKFIKPGSTVIDIGGHSGDTAIPMQFVAKGTVLSIEPNPTIKPYLDFCCNMNGHLGKFITANEAVTTQDGVEVKILDHNNALCNGGLIDPTWTPALQQRMNATAGDSFTATGMTLQKICDKYLTPQEIDNISFIKTDTEGHDKSIIESSKELINRVKPVIFTEWFFAYTDKESNDLFKVISDIGYKAFYPSTLEPATVDRRSDDLILIHNSKIMEYI